MRFASGVLVDWQRQLGESASVEQLSQAMAVKPEAIQRALEFQKTAGIIPFVKSVVIPAPVEQVLPQASPAMVEVAVTEVSEVGCPSEEQQQSVVDAPLAEVVEMPVTAEATRALEEVAGMVIRKKNKGRAKAAPKGKMPRGTGTKKGAASTVTRRPKSAGPAKSARVPAKGNKACVRLVAAQGASKKRGRKPAQPEQGAHKKLERKSAAEEQSRQWGRSAAMNRSRWQRERERSSLIAQLKPGMKLKRLWEGKTLEVVCVRDGYRYQGDIYPTLYSVVMAIVGTVPRKKQKKADGTIPGGTRNLTNWSAPKFFRLPWIIGGKKGAT
jgi:hypothetical protein